MKKIIALMLVLASLLTLAGCGRQAEAPVVIDTSDSEYDVEPTGITITILNTRSEFQEPLETMAKRYFRSTGVELDVVYSGEPLLQHLEQQYDAAMPYTIAMADASTIYNLYDLEHSYIADLAREDWASDTRYALTFRDVVLGFPIRFEGMGILYNADAVLEVTGQNFDPASVNDLDAFKVLLKQLAQKGMKKPCGIQRENASLVGDYLMQVFAEQLDPDVFVDTLYAGEADMLNNTKFNSIMDLFDVLKEYNYAGSTPSSADRQTTLEKLGEGEIAFCFGTNSDWRFINASEYTEHIGIMPLPQDTFDGANERLVGGVSDFFFVDGSDFTDSEERQAALDFLNWLVYDVEGNAFLMDDCGILPAFDGMTGSWMDPLNTDVKDFMTRNMIIASYMDLPADHDYVIGEGMLKYLTGVLTREELVEGIQTYWEKLAVPPHKAK